MTASFPAQDTLPVKANGMGRFGSLIALPLHGESRQKFGTTVFVDPDSWEPVADPWSRLDNVELVTRAQCEELVESGDGIEEFKRGPVRGERVKLFVCGV